VKDIGFSNTCGMRCVCSFGSGAITIFAPGDASTGGMFVLYVPNARALFEKMCKKLVTERPQLIGEYPADTGCNCCQSGGNYKIYNTHIELEHYSRKCLSCCGCISTRNIDFIPMSSISDQNKTETCCSGSYVSIFVKDSSSVLHANAGAALTQAKMDIATYQAVPVEFRLFVSKQHVQFVFDELNKRGGSDAKPIASVQQMVSTGKV